MKTSQLIFVLCVLLLSSCNRYYYSPNKVNIAGLREKNDLRIDAGLGGGWSMIGADVQTAYAIDENIGIMVNGSVTQNRSDFDSELDSDKTKSAYLEAGIGYFKVLEPNNKWVFEIYGGGGRGNYWLEYDNNQKSVLTMNRFFIQPAMVYKHPIKNIELGIASRIAVAKYISNRTKTTYPYSHYPDNEINDLVNGPADVFWEPSFRLSAGSEKVNFYFSVTPSLNLNQNFLNRELVNLNTGIRFLLNTSKKNNNF